MNSTFSKCVTQMIYAFVALVGAWVFSRWGWIGVWVIVAGYLTNAVLIALIDEWKARRLFPEGSTRG